MKSLFAVAENYPELKASQNFMELQGELTDTEDKIQAARRFYNNEVKDFNTKKQSSQPISSLKCFTLIKTKITSSWMKPKARLLVAG